MNTFYQCEDAECRYFNVYMDFIKILSNICPKCKKDTYKETDAETIVVNLALKQAEPELTEFVTDWTTDDKPAR